VGASVGGKRVDRLVMQLHDYLDQADAAERTGGPGPATPYLWRLYQLWKRWGVSPLELLAWPSALVEGLQACDIVEAERSPACAWAAGTGGTGRNLSVEGGDAS
jgi:hypothetical protein